jgi:hypothetical protein
VHPRISVTGDAKFSPRQLSIFLKPAIFSFGDHSSIANYIYIYIYIYIYLFRGPKICSCARSYFYRDINRREIRAAARRK